MSVVSVVDEAQERKYWTQIPNIVFKLGLSPYALTLYSVLKQTAGQGGASWKSTKTLAEECNMSVSTVSKTKQELTQPFDLLNGKPLIVIEETTTLNGKEKAGGRPYHRITIVDIWPENMQHFSSSQEKLDVSSSPHELETGVQVRHTNFASSPGELNNNPIEEYPMIEEKQLLPSEGPDGPPAGANGSSPPLDGIPVNLEGWLTLIDSPPKGSNVNAQLRRMYQVIFPDNPLPSFGRFGTTAKRVGGPSRLGQLIWEAAGKRPVGCVLDYIEAAEKGRRQRDGQEWIGRRIQF